MVKYGGLFKEIMKYRYGREKPTPQEKDLFKAVAYLGESFNCPSVGTKASALGMNGRVEIRRMDYSEADHIIVYYEGRDVFHITLGESDRITNYEPGDWEERVFARYYEIA